MKRTLVDKLLLGLIVIALLISGIGIYRYISQPVSFVLSWSTENEIDILGFNLLRADCPTKQPCNPADDAYKKVNMAVIPASADPLLEEDYEYIDENVDDSLLYYYKVETIFLSGRSEIAADPIILPTP